jgi:DNA-binding transcriptional regulator YdaS (Cro superfamily)
MDAPTGPARGLDVPVIYRAACAAGGLRELARRLGITPTAIRKWYRVPDDRIIAIEKVTGIPREKLRPDLYR